MSHNSSWDLMGASQMISPNLISSLFDISAKDQGKPCRGSVAPQLLCASCSGRSSFVLSFLLCMDYKAHGLFSLYPLYIWPLLLVGIFLTEAVFKLSDPLTFLVSRASFLAKEIVSAILCKISTFVLLGSFMICLFSQGGIP